MAKKKRKSAKRPSKVKADTKTEQPAEKLSDADTPVLGHREGDEPLLIKPYLPFLLLLAVIVVWLSPIIFAGRRPIGGEITSVYLPIMSQYDRAIGEGRLLLWNENSDFGVPEFAEGQIGGLYPIHLLLYGLFDTRSALGASMVFHFVLASWFAYLCARGFGSSRAAAMLTGLVFVGQGFFISRMDQPWSYTTGCWLPLAVLAAWSWLRDGKFVWLLSLTLILGVQLLAGHFQIAFFTAVVIVLLGFSCVIVETKEKRLVTLGRSALLPLAVFASLAVAAIQLVPTAELIVQSDTRGRGYTFLSSFATPPLHLVNYIAPTFLHQDPLWDAVAWVPWQSSADECLHYVGLIPLGLAIWSLNSIRTERFVRLWCILLLIRLGFCLGPYMPGYRWLIELPGFGWFPATTRWSIVCGLSLALLAGWGIDHIDLKTFNNWFPKFGLVVVIILGMGIGFIVTAASSTHRYNQSPNQYRGLHRTLEFLNKGYTIKQLQTVTPANQLGKMLRSELMLPIANLTLLVLAAFLAHRLFADRQRFVIVLLVWSFVDLSIILFLLRSVQFDDGKSLVQSSTVLAEIADRESSRIVGITGNLPMTINATPLVGPTTPDMEHYWDEQFRSESMEFWPGSLSTIPPIGRWADWGTRLGREAREGVSTDELEFFRLANIRALVCGYGSKTPPPDSEVKMTKELADHWMDEQIFGSGIEQLAIDSSWTFWEPQPDVTVARAWTFPVDNPPKPGTDPRHLSRPPPARRKMLDDAQPIEDIVDSGHQLRISGTSALSSVLVVSDLNYPGWDAMLTQGEISERVKIEQAFGRWRAVSIPNAGPFEVTFTYRPKSFQVGRNITVGAILLCLTCFAAAMLSRKK